MLNCISLSEDLIKGLIGLPLGVLGYQATSGFADWKKQRNYSSVGYAVLSGLIDEVKTGIDIMDTFIKTTKVQNAYLPSANWIGPGTISDDVLLRIIEITANHDDPQKFLMIREHLKNYFVNITHNWNSTVRQAFPNEDALLSDVIVENLQKMSKPNSESHYDAAKFVQSLLGETILLLKKDSEKSWTAFLKINIIK